MPTYIVKVEPEGSFFIAAAWEANAKHLPPDDAAFTDGRSPYGAASDALASVMPNFEEA